MPLRALLLLLPALLLACDDKDDDADGDGFDTAADCDDTDAAINPDAAEVCDGVDNNCDGAIDDDDDALDASAGLSGFVDSDGDGHGDAGAPVSACVLPDDAVDNDADCDDADGAISPDAAEVCDGVDNNCDGAVDDDDGSVDASTGAVWYADADADGFGDVADAGVAACDLSGSGHVTDNTDCDDADAEVNPAAVEVCDDLMRDDDCDGAVNDDDDSLDLKTASAWYPDLDEDGFGDDGAAPALACDSAALGADPHVLDGTDCDDDEVSTHPGADEVCDDSTDNDCDGNLDETCQDATEAGWTLDGEDSEAGYRLAAVDLDADGQDDLLVSGLAGAGSVLLLAGPVSGGTATSADATAEITGTDTGDYFGFSLSAGADVDADGYPEILVGALNAGDDAGKVYLFNGPISGAIAAADADHIITGSAAYDSIGYSLPDALGDLDGDGYTDLSFGGPYISSGSAYVFFGPLSGQTSASEADLVLTGASSSDGFGVWVDGSADLDGDGTHDLLVGADNADAVYAFMGPVSAGSLSAADADLTLTGSDEDFGASINHGDLNGDGSTDLIIGARYADTYAGTLYVYTGLVTGGSTATAEISGADTYRYLGSPLNQNAVADLDADGLDDLLLSDRYAGTEGAASVFLGPVSGVMLSTDGDYRFTGEAGVSGYFGTANVITDLDGDGLQDVVTSAYSIGQVYAFFGAGL